MRATAARSSQTAVTTCLACAVAWLVPGAGHLWLGRWQKGVAFLVLLPLMFLCGLAMDGRLFPFELSEPLVALNAFADMGLGAPYALTRLLGGGRGVPVALTYEYGNTFLIVAGLLNMLVVLDVHDIARGRK